MAFTHYLPKSFVLKVFIVIRTHGVLVRQTIGQRLQSFDMLVLLFVRVGGKGEQLDPAASDVHTCIGAVTTRGLQHRMQTAFLVNLSTAENNMNKTSAQNHKKD
jgi:hypothetical protein